MVLGNVIAIAQTNIKRMLAYSTIANMGFMLLGLPGGEPRTATRAAMFYMVVVRADEPRVVRHGPAAVARRASRADQLDDFKGLNQRSPWWAFIMLLVDVLAGRPAADGRLLREVHGDRGGGQRRASSGSRSSRC